MTDMSLTAPVPEADEELLADIEKCFEQMKRLREQMERDQAEIDKLKAATRTLLAQLKAA
ncbi:MAG TPA: hypothetical protein VKT77_10115 [Chthonomonadaceae bacterium]|nr:hypothetical protein [Chthonomonadaceae bacterium]